jgi:hypothetical protein
MGTIQARLKSGEYRTLGPILGRITLAQARLGGGAGMKETDKKSITALATALNRQAFEDGGKQLTQTELERFGWEAIEESDTMEMALIKAQNNIARIDGVIRSRLVSLDPKQRRRMGAYFQELKKVGVDVADLAPESVPTPPPPRKPTGAFEGKSGEVRVKTPDGQTFTFPDKASAEAFKKDAGIR